MTTHTQLTKRLQFFSIDAKAIHAVGEFFPIVLRNLKPISNRFYEHLLQFAEARTALMGLGVDLTRLKSRQVDHWARLFSCRFDDDYLAHALRIGQVHYRNRVSPYLYAAGYNHVHCELIALASRNYERTKPRTDVLTAVARLIALDMDIALSAYTREHWLRHPGGAQPLRTPDVADAARRIGRDAIYLEE